MRDEHDRAPFVAHAVEHVEALLLEGGVADGEHLVDQQDVRVDLDRDREGEAHVHAGGVVLELQVLELLELGELDHALVARARLARGEAEHDPVQRDVVEAARSGLKPTPSSMNVDIRPLHQICPSSAR